MYKLTFYVPESHLEDVKTAVFEAGGGRIGNYDSCCWQVKGQGQFRPLVGSSPYLGSKNKLEVVEEYKIGVVVADKFIKQTVAAMKAVHPYEELAYEVFKLEAL